MTAKQELLQIKLEFGHKASCRNRPTPEGFTHDWIVFVRGQDDKDISHFVEKVVFNLHESFHRPKRVIKDPPYKVEEHGYGSFSLPIDVYFNNKEQPKKVRIDYDLFLPAYGNPTIHNNRTEALKFLNPPDEFKKKVLKAGGEMLTAVNGTNSSPTISNTTSINGSSSQHHTESNGKEIKNVSSTNETEKVKKPKQDKQVYKPGSAGSTGKTSNTGSTGKTSNAASTGKTGNASNTGNKVPLSGTKRPSQTDDDEILPKVKKKKKKLEDNSQSQLNTKPTGFIPIEPPASGEEEQHTIGNSKDIKLKIKSLTTSKISKKSSKPSDKPVDKIDKYKEKKKDKLNSSIDSNKSVNNISHGDDKSKKKSSSNSKSKEKSSKSPQEPKTKVPPKQEERKVEKLMFRRESGDSWSSSTSSNSPGLSMLASSITGKNNALGTLMAELSDQDYDDDEDVDISTPFQTDSLSSKLDSSLSNNNVLHKKDNKSSKTNVKTKESKSRKETKVSTQSSKNGQNSIKSPTSLSKRVESSKSSSKISKIKSKNGKNGHQITTTDLVNLHKELTSLKDSHSLQSVVDILEQSGCFVITDTNLEFDLVRLDMSTIQQIQKCMKR